MVLTPGIFDIKSCYTLYILIHTPTIRKRCLYKTAWFFFLGGRGDSRATGRDQRGFPELPQGTRPAGVSGATSEDQTSWGSGSYLRRPDQLGFPELPWGTRPAGDLRATSGDQTSWDSGSYPRRPDQLGIPGLDSGDQTSRGFRSYLGRPDQLGFPELPRGTRPAWVLGATSGDQTSSIFPQPQEKLLPAPLPQGM